MPGISIHVVDVSRGVVASGMSIEVTRCAASSTEAGRRICIGRVGADGVLDAPELATPLAPGLYEARFEVARYYRDTGIGLPTVPFLDTVIYRFGIDDPTQHYHLPMKLTPWGLSCFRGGA